VSQAGQVNRVIELWVCLLLAGKKYTLVQVWKSSQSAAAMKNLMAVVAQRKQIAPVMLTTRTADEVVDLHAAPHI